jgi:hypothetical protein
MKDSTGEYLKRGDFVKMTQSCKDALINNDCEEHVKEFGECIGIVEGYVDYGNSKGPEVDVRWLPMGLRYGYDPENDLIKVTADAKELYLNEQKELKRKKDAEMKIYMMCEGNKGLLMGTSILPMAPDIGEYIEVNGLRISKKVFPNEYYSFTEILDIVLEKIKNHKSKNDKG